MAPNFDATVYDSEVAQILAEYEKENTKTLFRLMVKQVKSNAK